MRHIYMRISANEHITVPQTQQIMQIILIIDNKQLYIILKAGLCISIQIMQLISVLQRIIQTSNNLQQQYRIQKQCRQYHQIFITTIYTQLISITNSSVQINKYKMSDSCQKQYRQLLHQIKNTLTQKLTNKHDIIRARHWLQKLQQPVTNSVWKQNRNLYIKALYQMLKQGKLHSPFNQVPAQGALHKITMYDIAYPIRTAMQQRQQSHKSRKFDDSKCCHNIRKGSIQSHYNKSKDNSMGHNNKTVSVSRKSSIETDCWIEKNHTMRLDRQKMGLIEQRSRQGKLHKSKNADIMQHRKKINFQHSAVFGNTINTYGDQCTNENLKTDNLSFFQQTIKPGLHTEIYINRNDSASTKQTARNKNYKHSLNMGTNHQNQVIQKKGIAILKDGLKLLGNYYGQFLADIPYCQTIENIVRVGDKYGHDMRDIKLDISYEEQLQPNTDHRVRSISSSGLSQPFEKYSHRIKQNFTQCDNNFVEFMSYLRQFNN